MSSTTESQTPSIFSPPQDSHNSPNSTPPRSLLDLDLNKVDTALEDCLLSNLDLQEIRDALVSIAHDAGEMMLAADPSVSGSETKQNTSDRVTATDKAIEALVKARLAATHPNLSFLGEETSGDGQQKLDDAPTVVCDPIDGTLNFIHGFPNTAVSLALTVARKPVVGVVYNPFRRELFSAIKGRGAFIERDATYRRQLPLRGGMNPPPLKGLNDCLVAVEWGSQRQGANWELRTSVAKKLMSSKAAGGAMCHSLRSSGSAALDFCYVAAGWLDAFWEGGVWVWDVCAGWIILEEAGGLVVGANPGDWEPDLEGRMYMGVRAAQAGQKEVVEELWGLMDGKKFVHKK